MEYISATPATATYGSGLLGATASNPDQVEQARLLEIERRILAIEERLKAVTDVVQP